MASSGNFMTFMPSLASVSLANGNTKATGDGGNFDNGSSSVTVPDVYDGGDFGS